MSKLSKAKVYLIGVAGKKKTPREFKEARWLDGEEESLLAVIDEMLKAKGGDGLDIEKAEKSPRGEILLYETTVKYTKQGETEQRAIPVMMYYNPRPTRNYNTCVSGQTKDEAYKPSLRKMLLDYMVNLRFPISNKTSQTAFEEEKGLNIYVGDIVWAPREEVVVTDDGETVGTGTVWHCAMPARIEIAR